MRKPLRGVIFDLDGTLTTVRSSWRYLHERLGLWDGRADRHQERFLSGSITYEEFCRLDAAEWRGLSEARLVSLAGEVPYRPGIGGLMAGLRRAGVKVGVVSTGLTILSERVRREHGLDYAVANELVVVDGRCSGEVTVKVVHGRKGAPAREFQRRYGLNQEEVAAVGDTDGDVSLFEAAGFGIAVDPDGELIARRAEAVCGSLAEVARILRIRTTPPPGRKGASRGRAEGTR